MLRVSNRPDDKLRANTEMRRLCIVALEDNINRKGDCMNKGELIDAVAASAGLSRADATKAVDGVLDNITKALAGGNGVSLVGFGTFSVKQRAARTGRNPRTGEPIQIAASKVPGFKAGKALKDAVN